VVGLDERNDRPQVEPLRHSAWGPWYATTVFGLGTLACALEALHNFVAPITIYELKALTKLII
jgi:hypothetical protein